jgi:hypothetical protein
MVDMKRLLNSGERFRHRMILVSCSSVRNSESTALLTTEIKALELIFDEDSGATCRTRVPDDGSLGVSVFNGMLTKLVPTSTTAAASAAALASKSASIAAMARFSEDSCPVHLQLQSKWTAIGLLLDRLKLFFVLCFRIGAGAITNSVRTQCNDDALYADSCADRHSVDEAATMRPRSPSTAQFEQIPMGAAIQMKISQHVEREFFCFAK